MQSRQGQLLISATDLIDPNFHQTVTLVIQHDDQGAVGLTLNRPLEISFREAWEKVSDSPCNLDAPLLLGGPCEGPVMLIHDNPAFSQIQIMPGLHFSTDPEDVTHLVEHHNSDIRCFAGYAGWGPSQLEAELQSGSWITMDASPQIVFDDDLSNQWLQIIKTINPAQARIIQNPSIIPEDPNLN